MTNNTPTKKLGAEYITAAEDAIIKGMVDEMEAQMERMYADKKMLRQIHTKMHGCVKGTFQIEDNLPEDLRVGVFKNEQTYPCWVRFSNSSTVPKHDKKKDVRGIAIKVMGVEGDKIINDEAHYKTQDFLLMSSETFFSKNLKEFGKTMKAFTSGSKLKILLYVLNPLHWKLIGKVAKTNIKCQNPAAIPYWSTQPYQFGTANRAVKYFVKPVDTNHVVTSNTCDFDYLRYNLAQTLNNYEVKYEFFVQFQTNADTMPIEDPTVPWDSQFVKLATLTIPPQLFDSNKQWEYGENLSFNPWHSLPAHRPLGGFNRARRRAYEVMSKYRHKHNHMELYEPTNTNDITSGNVPPLKTSDVISGHIHGSNWLSKCAEVTVDCSKETAFKFISGNSELPSWLRKSGPIHGAVLVEVMKGPYDFPGATRKVIFDNGDTIIEQLIDYNPYANYAYSVTEFSNFFKHLTNKAYGQVWFNTVNDNTYIKWKYTFTGKNIFASLFIWLFLQVAYKKFMQQSLNYAKQSIEDGAFSDM